MFGYVRPLLEKLSPEDKEKYQAAYCGLCRTIGEEYGAFPKLFLNYDFAFLAMVLAEKSEPVLEKKACIAHPVNKRCMWLCDEGLSLAAAESLVLCYWKLRDSVSDEGFFKSLAYRFLSRLLKPAYEKAAKKCQDFDALVESCLAELATLETHKSPSIDRPADTFARILEGASGVHEEAGKAALSQMLYHVGRFIYLVDAYDDREKDKKSGNYNPILLKYGDDKELAEEMLRQTMYASLGLAIGAYEWMEEGAFHNVLFNILTLGLPAVEEAVLSGKWKDGKEIRSKAHEKSL